MLLLAYGNEIFTSVIKLVTIGSEVPIGRLDSHVMVGMIYGARLSGQCSTVTEDTRGSQGSVFKVTASRPWGPL